MRIERGTTLIAIALGSFSARCVWIVSFVMMAGSLDAQQLEHRKNGGVLRQWKWHGGDAWAPNGIDSIYRIENRFNGLAITSHPGRVGDPVHVRQFHSTQHELQRFTFEVAGDGYYYIRNQLKEPGYLEQPDPTRLRTTVITLAEVKAFGRKDQAQQEVMVSDKATASHNHGFNGDAYPAASALDGDLSNFSHTGGGADDWWEMDLGETFALTRLEIYNRDYYTGPLKGCTVRVFDEQRKSLWSSLLSEAEKKYIFDLGNIRGRYVRVGLEQVSGPGAEENILTSPGNEGDGKKWRVELVHPHGFYKIVNKNTGKALRALPGVFPHARLAAGQPVRQANYQDDDPFMHWNIEPVRDHKVDCLGVSQIGWSPQAFKFAVLTRSTPLVDAPDFNVTAGSRTVLSGKAIYWGSKWTQHFYVINLSALNRVGDYLLVCDGDAADLHVSDSAYSHIRHRGGSDTTVFSDIVDGKGFVGHWGRIDNWWSPEVMDEPYWLELDLDVNDKNTGERTKVHDPRQRIAKEYFAGWDHTDLYGSSQKCSAMVLRELAFAWQDNPLPSHNRALVNEMIYGAEYFVRIQNQDGSWPYKTNVITKLTGGVAAVSSALAVAYQPVKTVDPALANRMLAAAERGWEWVESNPDKWYPFNVNYRHGHYEERLTASLALYLVTNKDVYRNAAHEMILAAKKDGSNGFLIKPEDASRCNAMGSHVGDDCLRVMLQYHDQAPADLKQVIRNMADDLYMRFMDDHSRSSPFGGLEGSTGGYGSGVAAVRRAAYLYTMYQKFGDAYGAGYLVAERVMDWSFGCNPFATSTVFGCGDVFAIDGWARGYEKGSLLPGLAVRFDGKGMVTPIELTATLQGYGNAESEAGAGVAFIHVMALRHALRENPPTTVSFYSKTQYQGFPSRLPAGTYNEGQLKAFGILGNHIASVRIPDNFKVTLYAERGGQSVSFTNDQEDLKASDWNAKTYTIRIDASR